MITDDGDHSTGPQQVEQPGSFSRIPGFILLTVCLLGASYMCFALATSGYAESKGQDPRANPLARLFGLEAAARSRFVVGVVRSRSSMAYAASISGTGEAPDDPAAEWVGFLEDEDISHQVYDSVPSLDEINCNVLILPSVLCMSEQEIRSLRGFLQNGGGCLVLWNMGSRDEEGRWRRYSALQIVTGIGVTARTPETEPMISQCRLKSVPWVTDSVANGQSFSILRYGAPLMVESMEPRNTSLAHWLPKRRAPLESNSYVGGHGAAIVAGLYGAGRYVWVGFNKSSVSGGGQETQEFNELAEQTLLWAGKSPQVTRRLLSRDSWRKAWVGLEVSSNSIPFAADLVEASARREIPVVFFVDPPLLYQVPKTLKVLSGMGELSLNMGEGGVDGMSAHELRALRDRLTEIAGKDAEGIRISGPLLSRSLDRISEAGYRYVIAHDSNAYAPELVRLTRAIPLLSRPRYTWVFAELASVHQVEALSVPVIGFVQKLTDVKLPLRNPYDHTRIHVASLSELREEHESSSHVKQDLVTTGGAGSVLTFSNSGSEKVTDTVFDMYVPSENNVSLFPISVGIPAPDVKRTGPTTWAVQFASIDPGDNFSYKLVY